MSNVNEKFCTSVGYHLFETLSEAQKFCKKFDIPEEAIEYNNGKEHSDKILEVAMVESSALDEIKENILNKITLLENRIKCLESELEENERLYRGILSDSIKDDIKSLNYEVKGLLDALLIINDRMVKLYSFRKGKEYPFEKNMSYSEVLNICRGE